MATVLPPSDNGQLPLLLTVAQTSRLLSLGETTVREMVATGELRAVETSRRRVLIPRSEVERFASIELA